MFVHLNIHSIYSSMKGLLSLSEIINLAKSYSMDTLALTDVNGMWGFIRFVQICRDSNIKPIAGVNLITDYQEVLILVENQTGYENLCRIISDAHDNPDYNLCNTLKKYHSGLFILAYEAKLLKKLRKFVPDTHLFIELRPGFQESSIKRLSNDIRLEIVATGDVYFKNMKDHNTHLILGAIDSNSTMEGLNISHYKTNQHWFRHEAEMVKIFPNSLDALNNSRYLADRCKTDWSFINTIFPSLSLKDTHHSNIKLKQDVFLGAKKRYGNITSKIRHRINYELNIIGQKGFAPYFLIVKDIVTQTCSTIGRGSAAASIVSYCLSITQVDPIKYELHFERFIHPERQDMPDIDVDFPWDERDNILEYIFKKYGKERTAMVANQNFFKPRSAIREVGKVYGLSNEMINTITRRISYYKPIHKLERLRREDSQSINQNIDKTTSDILKESKKVIGAFRYVSVHPGGVIIVPDEIRKYVPVMMAAKGVQIVEWEKDQVEDSGLLKIDILGNRSLAVVRDTIKQVNINHGDSILQSKYLDYHQIQPTSDGKTEKLMKSGRTMGVFYIESPATRQLLKKSGIVDFKHVVIYSSIIRPAANMYTELMLSRIHGKPWKLPHPDLAFLRESYGIMVYEEQVSMAVMRMAGLGYVEAEALRKSMSRSSMQKHIPLWKSKFMKGAARRGYSSKLINDVWDMISSFVGYSFCKPHSASYAMLSFTCAYLKAHFPAEFISSVISNQGGYYSSYAYMSEARRLGIQILHPDINKSHYKWYGEGKTIQMGFMAIKGLKKKAAGAILEERRAGDFASLNDFLLRIDIDLADAMFLTDAGCFNKIASVKSHQEIAYQVAGFYLQTGSRKPLEIKPLSKNLTEEDRYNLELQVFGFPISIHPLAKYRPMLSHKIKYAKDIKYNIGQSIYLLGIYITSKESKTRKSEPMEFLTLEDESDIYECVLFPNVFEECGDLLHWETLFIIRGRIEESYGVCSVTIEKIGSLHQWIQRLTQTRLS